MAGSGGGGGAAGPLNEFGGFGTGLAIDGNSGGGGAEGALR